jgi:hypothetical protein
VKKKAAKKKWKDRAIVSSHRATTLTWADTGKPVTAGDLAEGEPFEVELTTGKVKRSARR